MPVISVKIATTLADPDLEARVAEAVAEASSSLLRKPATITAVIVERVDPRGWFVGGRSLAEHRKGSFWLEIKVTDGTNTKDEKQAFIAAIFTRMGDLLGPLHEESYVHVHEVIADAYGYGGVTQEHRYIAQKLASDLRRHAA